MSIQRTAAGIVGALATVLLIAGCAQTPASTGPTSSATDAPPQTAAPEPGDDQDFEAAWLDEGRMFAVLTWGSSTCVPVVDEVVADGQNVRVTLVDPDPDAICTADYAARASAGAFPEGVDPSQDVELTVTYGSVTDDADLDGDAALTGVPGTPTEYAPSAGWLDDASLVLLTWGSSTCLPIVESVEGAGSAGTVTFVTDEEQACTMDMVPRTTMIVFADDQVEDDGFQLTLVGGGLDATVPVRG